jgi:hypothetical protein
MVKVCYVDEAGCTGSLESATSNVQPTLTIAGIIVDYSSLHRLTAQLIGLKQKFYPRLLAATSTHLDWIRAELKGSELRKQACSASRNERRHAFGVLDAFTELASSCGALVAGRIWIKGIGKGVNGMSIYTYSIQSIYQDFQRHLQQENDIGFVVVDSRLKHLNSQVAHSVFTQKFKGSGDSYDRIVELPAFSHSDNHAGLQLADVVCSAIVTPCAIQTYCEPVLKSIHIRPGYSDVKARYITWLKGSQFRYTEANGRTRGGLIISDSLTQRPGGELFRVPPLTHPSSTPK